MNQEEKKKLLELLDQHVAQLREHFDSVRIFVTKDSDDGQSDTVGINSGKGNLYAQHGQVREWLIVQEQYAKDWASKHE